MVAAIALAACAGPTGDTTTTTDGAQPAPPADAIDVTVTGVDLSSDGVTIGGEAPTPCNDLGSTISTEGGTIEVRVWAEPLDEDETCAQVIEPFEMTLDFETPETETPVTVNGEEVGRVGG